MFGSLTKGDELVLPPPKKREKIEEEEEKKPPIWKKKKTVEKLVLQELPKTRAVEAEYFTDSYTYSTEKAEEDEEVEGEKEASYGLQLLLEPLPEIKMDIAASHRKTYSDKASTPLNLEKQTIRMEIVGATVKTSTTMVFHNNHSEVLAGTLVFPLPKDTSISGYGLDLQGVMVDAVPVPKEKARIAFETTVRERGPAISVAEKVDQYSNAFKTNIYPMSPNGRRTVKVVTLNQMIDDKKHSLFFTHVQKPASLKEFKLEIETPVPGTSVMVRRISGAMEPVNAEELEATDDFEGILLIVPKIKGPGCSVTVEKDIYSGYYYFSATFSNLDETFPKPVAAASKVEKKEFRKIKVYFDCSTSRSKSDYKQEIKVLQAFMTSHPECKVEVAVFSNAIHQTKSFKKPDDLLKFMASIEFDGGTSLPLDDISTTKDTDFIILCSDGLANFGGDLETQLFSMVFNCPIFCFSSSSPSAYVMFRYLGEKSGGNYFDVTEQDSADILKKIEADEQFGIKNLIYDPLRTTEVFASPVINNSVSIYGMLIHDSAGYVQLDFGGGRKFLQADIFLKSKAKNIKILPEGSTSIRTLWAQKKIDQLSVFQSKNSKEIERIGMDYGIVTSQTSLVVLSELSQYQRWEIVPPKQLKAMRKEYLNHVNEIKKNEENRKKNKIDNVLGKWKRRIDWHKRDFKPETKKFEKKKKKKMAEDFCDGFCDRCCMRECLCDCCCCGKFDEAESYGCMMDDCKKLEEEEEEEEEEKEKEESCSESDDEEEISLENCKKEKKKQSSSSSSSNSSSISVKAYIPGSTYLTAIKKAKDKYKEYMKQKIQFSDSPSFYLDCCDYFFLNKMEDKGIQILTNILELELSNVQLLRIIGYRLDQAGFYEEAISIFQNVLKLKPEEPQSYRDLALVLEKIGEYEEALKLLYNVVTMNVDGRFDEIELTALVELNHVLFQIDDEKEKKYLLQKYAIEKDFVYNFFCDIRISMAWDTDSTDIDLHVYDPDNEHCYFSHKNTKAGGFISRDFVEGYGPEEFMQKKVHRDGTFRITAKYFANHQQSLTGGTTILCTFFTHYLMKNEKRSLATLRLNSDKDEVEVCQIKFKMN